MYATPSWPVGKIIKPNINLQTSACRFFQLQTLCFFISLYRRGKTGRGRIAAKLRKSMISNAAGQDIPAMQAELLKLVIYGRLLARVNMAILY